MLAAIANFINLLLAALNRLANPLGDITLPDVSLPDISLPAIPSPFGDTQQGTKPENETSKPSQRAPGGKRSMITIPENITARFADRGSPAWVNQQGPLGIGYHYGTDFGAPPGSPVFAPYAGNVVSIGHYSDAGRLGDYVIMHLADGAEYYSGHLDNVKVKVGDTITAGQQLGVTNQYAHTHVQLRLAGVLSDFEKYSA